MFGFHKKKALVLDHWIAFADGFQSSPVEFFSDLETELSKRMVPKMEMIKMEFSEGGLLSEKRVYLRMVRERIVFDICAAPFGKGFFFSCRTCEIPCVLQIWQLFFVFGFFLFSFWAFVKSLGLVLGLVILLGILTTGIYCMRNLVAMGLQDLDTTISQSPLLGSIYEIFFRAETYHRIDSRLCYIHLIPSIVKTLAEDTTAEKGVKLLEQFELNPILGDLYKRTGSQRENQSNLPSSEPRLSI